MQRARHPNADMPDSSYEFLTNAQRRISQKKRAAERSMETGAGGARAFDEADVLRADEGELVTALDNVTGGLYAAARSRYADDMQLQEAFDYGFGKAMAPGTEISFLRKEWGNMTKAEKVAARAGVRSWLGQKSGSLRGGRATARDVFREGDAQDKLRIVFGEETTNKLAKAMEGQEAMWLTDDALTRAGGSQTARMTSSRINPENSRVDVSTSLTGLALRGGQAALNHLNKPSGMTRSLGPALAARGDQRAKLVQALLDVEMQKAMGQPSQTVQNILANAAVRAPASTVSGEDILQLIVRPKRRNGQ